MSEDSIKALSESEVYSGKIIQVIHRDYEVSKNGHTINMTYEIARRAPGVRLITYQSSEVLLTREYRAELEAWDYRLPGGKVFDLLGDYLKVINDRIAIEKAIAETVIREGLEEANLIVNETQHFYTSKAGSSIDWDLHYFLVSDFDHSDKLENSEQTEIIDKPIWVGFDKIIEMCVNGEIKEDRSVGILLRFVLGEMQKK